MFYHKKIEIGGTAEKIIEHLDKYVNPKSFEASCVYKSEPEAYWEIIKPVIEIIKLHKDNPNKIGNGEREFEPRVLHVSIEVWIIFTDHSNKSIHQRDFNITIDQVPFSLL